MTKGMELGAVVLGKRFAVLGSTDMACYRLPKGNKLIEFLTSRIGSVSSITANPLIQTRSV